MIKEQDRAILEELGKKTSFKKPVPSKEESRKESSMRDNFFYEEENNEVVSLNLDMCNLSALPDSIGKLTALHTLSLKRNSLDTLPRAVNDLSSLKRLNLENNKLEKIPESLLNLKSLEQLYLANNKLTTIPDAMGNLAGLTDLDLARNKIGKLPESMKKLTKLTFVGLSENQLLELPEWIGELKLLKYLGLAANKLKNLPTTINKLKNLTDLNLFKNQLTEVPLSIWGLSKLEKLDLRDNPWNKDVREIATQDVPSILRYCRRNSAINIFCSHAVADFNYFKIKELSAYLEQYPEIDQAIYCEEDLSGNIDEFMNAKLPDCQLVLFFASQKSMVNSIDCKHELELARQYQIQIIPIKGKEASWADLGKINLSRELGFEYDDANFESFCDNLYKYIKKYKSEVDLFEPEAAKIDKQKFIIKNNLNNFLESPEFAQWIKNHIADLAQLSQYVTNKQLSLLDYYLKIGALLAKG